jgi:hypothetical protein
MRFLLSFALSSLLIVPPVAAAPGDVCRPSQPDQPVNSEDNNPGLGSVLGLNDDREDVHPFGLLYSQNYVIELAQNGAPGDASYLGTQTGNDCALVDEDDE